MSFTLLRRSLASSVRTVLRAESSCISASICLCLSSSSLLISSILFRLSSASSLIFLLFLVRFFFLAFGFLLAVLLMLVLLPQGFPCLFCPGILDPCLNLLPCALVFLEVRPYFLRLGIEVFLASAGNNPSGLALLDKPFLFKHLQAHPYDLSTGLSLSFRRLSPVLPSAVIASQFPGAKGAFL